MTGLTRLFTGLALLVAACGGGGSATTPTSASEPGTSAPNKPAPATQANLGDATDIQLLDANGSAVKLASAWADQPAVVIFYRGHW